MPRFLPATHFAVNKSLVNELSLTRIYYTLSCNEPRTFIVYFTIIIYFVCVCIILANISYFLFDFNLYIHCSDILNQT